MQNTAASKGSNATKTCINVGDNVWFLLMCLCRFSSRISTRYFIDSWVLAIPKCAVNFFICELFEIRECRQYTVLAIHTLAIKRDRLAFFSDWVCYLTWNEHWECSKNFLECHFLRTHEKSVVNSWEFGTVGHKIATLATKSAVSLITCWSACWYFCMLSCESIATKLTL